MILKKANKRTW